MKFDACCSPTNNIPTATGTYTSTCSTTDAGWTYYCDASENLLLALEIGSSGAVIADDEVQLNIGATTTSTYDQYCGVSPNCFIDLSYGATVFNRSWDVNPTTQPSSGDVGVKFYYTQDEYDAVSAGIGGLSGMDEMWFYKVTNGETFPSISSLEASEVSVLTYDATTPATDKWVLGTKEADSEYFAEYLVSSFSGGGGGGFAEINSGKWDEVGIAGFSSGTTGFTSMCMDGSTPYIAYQDGDNGGKATVMKYDGSNWVSVGSSGFSASDATYISLAMDGSTPYVGYRDAGNSNKATVMKYDGSNWVTVGSVGFSASGVAYVNLRMDGSTPYISYEDEGNSNKATVMKYDGSNWVSVGSSGFSASDAVHISLVMDGSTPYVGYRDAGNGNKVTVMKYDGSSWVTVGSAGFSENGGYYMSLSMDGSTPYISYKDQGNSDKATVMKYDGSNWVTVGSAGFSAGSASFTSLSMYGSTPYVAYRDGGNSNNATVMKYDGSNWVTVGPAGFSAGTANYTSLSMYGNIPYVAYIDLGNSSKATVMTFDASCSPTYNIPTATGTYTSAYSTTDAGWTYYCDASENLLLALEIGSSGAVIADDEVQLNIGATTTSTYAQYCGGASPGCFIDLADGGTVFNRSWDVNPTTQPSSGNVGVKFYYTQAEYDAVDAAITGGLSGMDEMWFYKVTNGETFPTISSLEASEVLILTNDASTPAEDKWVMGTKVASSEYFAEYMVSSFSGGGGGGAEGGLSPLPIELIYFHVYADGDNAKLKWSTASETNNRGFEIQHSIDGEDWRDLGFVDGIGNSVTVTNYNFTHEEPRVGINYYRLKQIDLDGKVEFLPIKNIHFASNENEPISIYPNPAKEFLYITNVKGQGEIYNFSGQLVLEMDLKEDGINSINVSELGQGVFHLVVNKANGERVIKRFMK